MANRLGGGSVFGPLNGVRTTLVAFAALAAIIAAAFGEWVVTLVLAVGIAAHGLLWAYLWRRRDQGPGAGES